MPIEFKTIVQLQQEGAFDQLLNSLQDLMMRVLEINLPMMKISNELVITQTVIASIAIFIIGIIYLPFGATPASIKSCQSNYPQKLLKSGGALLVVMTCISAILFIEIMKPSEIALQI